MRFQFRPLVTTRGVVGVCGFEPADPTAPISPTLDHALNLILDQTAIAVDRALLVKDSLRTAALEDNEKLRTTLLASLSHDLRTPLAAITGAVTTLQRFGDTLDAGEAARPARTRSRRRRGGSRASSPICSTCRASRRAR